MRQWTLKYMPASIRKALNIPDALPRAGVGTQASLGTAN
jgi:hypothetical protein